MILGPKALLELVKTQKLVENLSERELTNPEGAGFDLRLGEVYKITGDAFLGETERKTADIELVQEYKEGEKRNVVIKPGDYFLVSTIEVVNTPLDLTVNFKPRTTTFRSGLFLRTGNVAPGYKGKLTFGLKNEGPIEVTIEMGARFVHAQFEQVLGEGNQYRGQWQGGRVAATKKRKTGLALAKIFIFLYKLMHGKTVENLLRDIEFIYEIGSLRFMQRTWVQFLQTQVADNADHIFRVMWISLVIARHEGIKNEEKIIKMALLHDIPETRAPDTNYVSKIYSTRDEEKALKHMLEDTVFAKEFEELFAEYEKRETIESKIVKDADNLDVDFELSEIYTRGHAIKKDWQRKNVRKSFFTKTAEEIWDELQTADPNKWHTDAHTKYIPEKDRKL